MAGVVRRVYALALIVAVLVAVLTPIHARATRSWWVVGTVGDDLLLEVADPGGIEVGETLPLYRFHPGHPRPIGRAVVVGAGAGGLVVRPVGLRFPAGRHGRVLHDAGQMVELDLRGAEPKQRLTAFVDGRRVANLRVIQPSADRARAMVERLPGSPPDLAGAVVSEFSVPTRAVVFDVPWLGVLEGVAFALALGAWALSWVHPGPGRAWTAAAGALRRGLAALAARPAVRVAFHAALAVPVAWVGGALLWYALTWIPYAAAAEVLADNPFPRFPDAGLPYARGAVGLAYVGWLLLRGTSPLLALWDALAWRPVLPGVPARFRPYALWALHLLVAWAFASTLGGFLAGNVKTALDIVRDGLDAQGAFQVARYALWSFTIVGCLVGYGHTVLSVLWTKPMRELDFSIAGWATTASCYGPLLGVVVAHAIGGAHAGRDPLVTAGPLYGATLAVELLLNALYTASIWNLGTYFGVMTDKGVRTTGFYAVVRHPSYTLEALMFAVMGLPIASGPAQWVMLVAFPVKYWLRSEREDHFMGRADPDYGPYREAVPWKFVPGLY